MSSERQPTQVPDDFPGELPQFQIGQIIRHRRYDYRGVVVDFDMTCQADDDWYASNQTHPDRDQPWYHVLVDGSDATTYTAESSLGHDGAQGPVDHPLVEHFFDKFVGGRYERNDECWPAW